VILTSWFYINIKLEGKPKISRKTVYYVSIHAKHVEERKCRDEKTIFYNGILAIIQKLPPLLNFGSPIPSVT